MNDVSITGVWLKSTDGRTLEVSVEIDGQWRRAIVEHVSDVGGVISHICEPLGMSRGSIVKEGPRGTVKVRER